MFHTKSAEIVGFCRMIPLRYYKIIPMFNGGQDLIDSDWKLIPDKFRVECGKFAPENP